MKGYDAAAHVLACFGGAGGQHACAIATALGMKTIFVHRWALPILMRGPSPQPIQYMGQTATNEATISLCSLC
jgi:N-methylhydantoinase A/oxoprolinase/acetone carboxylase beta subunit